MASALTFIMQTSSFTIADRIECRNLGVNGVCNVAHRAGAERATYDQLVTKFQTVGNRPERLTRSSRIDVDSEKAEKEIEA